MGEQRNKAAMDLLEDDPKSGNTPEFTVSEISGAVKKTLESAFGRIRVRGEIGRVMRAASGHLYYDLKDERNVLSCNTWKGQVSGLGVMPEEGLEVIVTGKVSAFGGQSRYNINVDSIEVAGEGALMALLEKRKKQLAAEGLFDPVRKKPIPYLPEIIAVVTSPQGAVIRDILHRLRDRFPRKVLIWPVAVQGDACAPQVKNAIEGLNALTPGGALPRPDLIIVARGGGSIEDLWGFNDEAVARAAAASDIPLISAVGHETDTTLIDFVSDQRAPTPTAAAELAVPVRLELLAGVTDYGTRLARASNAAIERRRQRLADLARAMPRPGGLTESAAQRLDLLDQRFRGALKAALQAKELDLQKSGAALRSGLLSARVRRERDRLNGFASRLQPGLVGRPLAQKAERLEGVLKSLSRAAQLGLKDLRARLERLDQLRETLGYQATLARGYAVIWSGDQVLTSVGEAAKARSLEIQFKDGRHKLSDAASAPSRAKPKTQTDGASQGSLFGDEKSEEG